MATLLARVVAAVLAALSSLSAASAAATDSNIILPPLEGREPGQDVMLVFVPGGAVPNEHYEKTVAAIQAAASEVRLWGVIPGVFNRLCIIQCTTKSLCSPLHDAVESALSTAEEQGWKRNSSKIWLAGHSLGGVCANTLFQAYSSEDALPYAGLIEMGSYVDTAGAYDVMNYPRPVLTLNAELDAGLARPGKTAIWWRQHLALRSSMGSEAALRSKPVIVLPKVNHSDFCPGFNVPGDLMAEVDQATATKTIAEIVAAFLQLNADHKISAAAESGALAALRSFSDWTAGLLEPYLQAQDMEHNSTAGGGDGRSPFCVSAQHLLSGLTEMDDSRLLVSDEYQVSQGSLEHCHTNYSSLDSKLQVKTCSHADYYANFDNTGSMSAASQVACKMLSVERLAQQLNISTPGRQPDCLEANRQAVKVAEALATPTTLERYRRSGRGWCFLEDFTVPGNIGPLWLLSNLKLEENTTCMAVSSPTLLTGLDSKIYPGNKYCKLLSPARALDWMMSDSLKPGKSTLASLPAVSTRDVLLV